MSNFLVNLEDLLDLVHLFSKSNKECSISLYYFQYLMLPFAPGRPAWPGYPSIPGGPAIARPGSPRKVKSVDIDDFLLEFISSYLLDLVHLSLHDNLLSKRIDDDRFMIFLKLNINYTLWSWESGCSRIAYDSITKTIFDFKIHRYSSRIIPYQVVHHHPSLLSYHLDQL